MSRTANIRLTIDLDSDNLPTAIEWDASEARREAPAQCQSMMLSLWDHEEQTTAAIDLWTRDMTVQDMNLYFYQVIHKMADTYQRATGNADIADVIHHFANQLGASLGLAGDSVSGGAVRDDGAAAVDLVSLARSDRSGSDG